MSTASPKAAGGSLTGVLTPSARPAAPGITPVSPDEAVTIGRARADLLRSMGITDTAVLTRIQELDVGLEPMGPLPENAEEAPNAREEELTRRRGIVMKALAQTEARNYLADLGSTHLLEDARRLRVDPCFPETVPTDEGQRAIELGKWMESFTAAIYEADERRKFIERAQAPWWQLIPWWAWLVLVLLLILSNLWARYGR